MLYCDGFFVQSRNFNLQRVGDINWLKKNYDLKNISNYIDELIVLNVSRGNKNFDDFIINLKILSKNFFTPLTAGGGINSFENAKKLFFNGADKVLINSAIFKNDIILNQIADVYGEQSIVGGIDLKKENNNYEILINNGTEKIENIIECSLKKITKLPVGEIYLNSIDKDGTGMGLDFKLLDLIPSNNLKPIILSGGCGNVKHFEEGLKNHKVYAIATANLFNFIGDGLEKARKQLLTKNIRLPTWNPLMTENLKMILK